LELYVTKLSMLLYYSTSACLECSITWWYCTMLYRCLSTASLYGVLLWYKCLSAVSLDGIVLCCTGAWVQQQFMILYYGASAYMSAAAAALDMVLC